MCDQNMEKQNYMGQAFIVACHAKQEYAGLLLKNGAVPERATAVGRDALAGFAESLPEDLRHALKLLERQALVVIDCGRCPFDWILGYGMMAVIAAEEEAAKK